MARLIITFQRPSVDPRKGRKPHWFSWSSFSEIMEDPFLIIAPAQGCEYDRFHSDVGGAGTYGGEDLSDIPIKVGDIEGVIPVVEKAQFISVASLTKTLTMRLLWMHGFRKSLLHSAS